MSEPRRYQRKRTIGADIPADAVYVGRPTIWGNPFVVGTTIAPTAEVAVELFRHHMTVGEGRHLPIHELRGKSLICWCRLDAACHADVLLLLAREAP
jgi:hypothetical protein